MCVFMCLCRFVYAHIKKNITIINFMQNNSLFHKTVRAISPPRLPSSCSVKISVVFCIENVNKIQECCSCFLVNIPFIWNFDENLHLKMNHHQILNFQWTKHCPIFLIKCICSSSDWTKKKKWKWYGTLLTLTGRVLWIVGLVILWCRRWTSATLIRWRRNTTHRWWSTL